MTPTTVIDCFPERAPLYRRGYAVVAVDVIRATTTIATAVAHGRHCFPVSSLEAAHRLAAGLQDPLLAGELGGVMPAGFEMNNSPAELNARADVSRPLILLSSSGTRLIDLARQSDAVYVGCLRNFAHLAQHIATRHSRVAIIGAGSRRQFREEDQMCCAWIAGRLLQSGFSAANSETISLIKRWPEGDLEGIEHGPSATYLIRSGQVKDLEFVLTHVGDLSQTLILDGKEVIEAKRCKFIPANEELGKRESGVNFHNHSRYFHSSRGPALS